MCRRFDICMNNHFDEIPFFTMTEGLRQLRHGRVCQMCCELGEGGGSVRHCLTVQHLEILPESYITVYPLLVHQLKMRLPGKKTIPQYILGKCTKTIKLIMLTDFINVLL